MKKTEILAPAGSKDSLIAAVQNGADAVYLGGQLFNARANAANFSMEDLKWATEYGRSYGVSVYITVNTLIFDDEFEALFTYIDQLVELHVDALIVQDVGMAYAISQRYPDLPLHASTQMHIHNVAQVLWAKKMGFTRIVAARETPIEILREMVATGVEIEVFVHGALCVSYSGQCLMSNVIGGRSGNRGECAQPCRLPYTLMKRSQNRWEEVATDGSFLISPKDLCTLEHLKELCDAGIVSMKIEGRMKRPEYVAQVVSSYRKELDRILNHQSKINLEPELHELRKIFSRGFTSGFMFNNPTSEILQWQTSSHVGVKIGKVISCNGTKIQIKLSEDLKQGDGIRIMQKGQDEGFTVNFLYVNDLLVKEAKAPCIIELQQHTQIDVGSDVVKTSDIKQLNRLQEALHSTMRRVDVSMELTVNHGQAAVLNCSSNGRMISVTSDAPIDRARQTAIDDVQLSRTLAKTGDTIFQTGNITIHNDNQSFIAVSQLNALRRKALDELAEKCKKPEFSYAKSNETVLTVPTADHGLIRTALVTNQTQLNVCIEEGVEEIICDDPSLFPTLDDPRFYVRTLRVNPQGISEKFSRIVVSTFNDDISDQQTAHGDFGLNVSNARTAAYYLNQGLTSVMMSVELNPIQQIALATELKEVHGSCGGLETMIYGHREMMVMRSCPISIQYGTTPLQCALCHNQTFGLKDRKGSIHRMAGDRLCMMHITEDKADTHLSYAGSLYHSGIHRFRFTFLEETAGDIRVLLRQFESEVSR